MVGMMDGFQAKQAEMIDEIQALRRENQQLRNLFWILDLFFGLVASIKDGFMYRNAEFIINRQFSL